MYRTFKIAAAGFALVAAAHASAQSDEPVVWTELADPDPHFVAPPEPLAPARTRKARARVPAATSEQQAYEAGRSVAEAAMALEAAACKVLREAEIPPAEAPPWSASCPP